jgi:FkbH-like protein
MSKIAVLSNVNMNVLIRLLEKEQGIEVYQPEGYGNELGLLYDKASSYHAFSPKITFMIMDLLELIGAETDIEKASERIQTWFAQLEQNIENGMIYYISDAYLWGCGIETCAEPAIKARLEHIWLNSLLEFIGRHENVRIFPYAGFVQDIGAENAFSKKMWYMGKILLSNDAQKRLCSIICHKVSVEERTPKKILFLDLDNTLWGGLAGENDVSPIKLSDDHLGLAYKNLQRVLLGMQRQGVLLGIISKNNRDDALDIIEKHPHMILRGECFAVKEINWESKAENIVRACKELNIGTDSAVFFDDSPAERELVKTMLPEVIVPDFPDRAEELPDAMEDIYHRYFEKGHITAEDINKTRQYAQNAERNRMLSGAGNYDDYLEGLEMVMKREDPKSNAERFLQLVNKTNQFNLTTKRYTLEELNDILANPEKKTFLYRVSDRFGDNGIVAALIADMSGQVPYIEEFVMSCRVMGRHIEHAIVTDVEKELSKKGADRLRGIYIPTAKNAPVAGLYEELGYTKCSENADGSAEYEIEIAKTPKRVYHVTVA